MDEFERGLLVTHLRDTPPFLQRGMYFQDSDECL